MAADELKDNLDMIYHDPCMEEVAPTLYPT